MYQLPARTALACLALFASHPCDGDVGDANSDFARAVAAFDGSGGEQELEQCALELAKLPEGVSSYFTLVTDERPPTRAQARLLERTAAYFSASLVVDHVRSSLTEASSDAWRRTALGLLGMHASSDELSLLSDVTVVSRIDPVARPALVEPFQAALTNVIQREGVRVRDLRWFVDAVESLRGAAIRSVGASGDPEGLRWLVWNVEHAEHGSAALQEIARLARVTPADIAREVAPYLERLLLTYELGDRKHVLRILGDLGRSSSIPHLIRTLKKAETSGERKMAHTALRRVTQLDLPARAEVWADWCKEEQLWFDEQGGQALERLASANDAEVVAAIQQLSSHHLHRDEVAQALAPLLGEHPSPTIRGQVCVALGRLRSNTIIAELEAALDDEDEGVRERARAALEGFDSKSAVAKRR